MSSRSLVALGLFAIVVNTSCKKTEQAAQGAEATEAHSAKATAPNAKGGACDELTSKMCDSAGAESDTCTSAKGTLALLSDTACKAALNDFAQTKTKLAAMATKCDELIEKLCTQLGKESESCQMVVTQTKTFPAERCVAMLDHVDEIASDLKQQEEQQRIANQPLNEEQQRAIAEGDAPGFGPVGAKVTLVEFSDFECPYCSRAAQVTEQIKEKYGSKVRFVFRQFPLSFHPNAQLAAEASLAAHAQGKFWDFHDKMFENQNALDRSSLEGYAQAAGLDLTQFKAALDNNTHAERVKGDLAMGNDVAVQGTPTLFLNGQRIPDPTNFAAVSQAIDAALGG